jgi:hypothetical protein
VFTPAGWARVVPKVDARVDLVDQPEGSSTGLTLHASHRRRLARMTFHTPRIGIPCKALLLGSGMLELLIWAVALVRLRGVRAV